MRLFSYILLGLFVVTEACQSILVPQTPDITRNYFPDPEVSMETPAFNKDKGFTSYAEMMDYLNARVQAHPELLSLSFIGNSQKGLQIPMLSIKNGEANEKIRVWLQAGLHGNEPAGTEAMLYLVDQLCKPEYADMLANLDIRVLPMANIDGCEKFDRYAANGLDLNRDQTKIAAPETRSIKTAFTAFAPQVCLDLHEYRPYRRDFTQISEFGITNSYDVMFLYSGNLNVPAGLRAYTETRFVANARASLDGHGMTHHDYFTAAKYNSKVELNQGSIHARSTATSAALTNCISTLLEVRGIALGRTSYKRRVYSTWLVALSFLKTASEHGDEVRSQLKQSGSQRDSAVVKQKRTVYQDSIEVIELGQNRKVNIRVTIHDALQSVSTLSRSRPQAYLIDPAQTELLDRIRVLGLETHVLENDSTIWVDQYRIEGYEVEPIKWEQVSVQNTKTRLVKLQKTFTKGTVVLDMSQTRANLAIELLEPEAPNSLVSMSIVATESGAVLPYYRYPSQN